MALGVVHMPIVASVPLVHLLIQAVKPRSIVIVSLQIHTDWAAQRSGNLPIASRRQVRNLLRRHGVGHRGWDRVADEHVRFLDIAPEEVPDVGLRRARLGNEIASDLDVRSVEHWSVRRDHLDQRDQARHLRVVDLVAVSVPCSRPESVAGSHVKVLQGGPSRDHVEEGHVGAGFLEAVGGKGPTYNDNISTTLLRWAQWTALGEPVAISIFSNPVNDSSLLSG